MVVLTKQAWRLYPLRAEHPRRYCTRHIPTRTRHSPRGNADQCTIPSITRAIPSATHYLSRITTIAPRTSAVPLRPSPRPLPRRHMHMPDASTAVTRVPSLKLNPRCRAACCPCYSVQSPHSLSIHGRHPQRSRQKLPRWKRRAGVPFAARRPLLGLGWASVST